MWFRNSQSPPPSNGFPPDAVVVVIPKVVLDRLFTISAIVILLALGSTITLTHRTLLRLAKNLDHEVVGNVFEGVGHSWLL
jgi:hypothetical protein